jgi:hypothetical protein
MENCSMMGASICFAFSWLSSDGAENKTRMKKRLLLTSPNWALSVMLQPLPAKTLAIAATIPGLSSQDRVSMKDGLLKDMDFRKLQVLQLSRHIDI